MADRLVEKFTARFPKRRPPGTYRETTSSVPGPKALGRPRWYFFRRRFLALCGLLLVSALGLVAIPFNKWRHMAAIWSESDKVQGAAMAAPAEQTAQATEGTLPESGTAEAEEPPANSLIPPMIDEPNPIVKRPFVTNIWMEADLRAVLYDITAQTGILIIPDSMVEGVVSLEAEDMPVEECLDRVAETGPWGYKKVEDYYIFGSTAPGSHLADMLGAAKRVKLNYANATEVHALLPRSLARYVQVGKETNVLAVTAPEPAFTRVLDRIAELDVPQKQVVVEVLIVQLSEKGRKELGIDWQWQENQATGSVNSLIGIIKYSAESELAQVINVRLKVLIFNKEAKVLATPRLMALDRQQASIYVGEEKYYTLLSGYADRPYYTLEAIKAGVTLKITPYIGDNDEITLDIEPEVSEVATNWDSDGNNLPVINRRTARTTVRARDGETIVIGGLLHEEETKAKDKVPILGDIPLLGLLFQKTKDVTMQTEVVIFITPRLVTDAYATESLREKQRFESLRE